MDLVTWSLQGHTIQEMSKKKKKKKGGGVGLGWGQQLEGGEIQFFYQTVFTK